MTEKHQPEISSFSSGEIHLGAQVIISAARQTRNYPYHFMKHIHRSIEIYLIDSGSCAMDINNRKLSCTAGDFVMILPNTVHSFYLDAPDTCLFRHIHFDPAPFSRLYLHGTGEVRNVSIADVFYKCEWPGMVLAYRRAWFQGVARDRKLGENSRIPHDFLVCALAAEAHGFLQLDNELAYHRRHDSNAGGEEHRLSRLLNRERKLGEIKNYNRLQIGRASCRERV